MSPHSVTRNSINNHLEQKQQQIFELVQENDALKHAIQKMTNEINIIREHQQF